MSESTVDPYHFSRSLRGVPSPGNRTHRASQSSWKRGMSGRTVGVATDANFAPLTDYASVKVTYADGSTAVKSAASFRPEHISTKSRNHRSSLAAIDHQNKMDEIRHQTAADLPAIGNVE